MTYLKHLDRGGALQNANPPTGRLDCLIYSGERLRDFGHSEEGGKYSVVGSIEHHRREPEEPQDSLSPACVREDTGT